MSKSEKKLDSMRNNPRDWQISDVENVARAHGVTVRKGGGSHVTFSHPTVSDILTIPARRPIKAPYIRDFVNFIDSIALQAE
jgi:predicted RNA binding protein YcfA (HicA-like mRNA interferase family)